VLKCCKLRVLLLSTIMLLRQRILRSRRLTRYTGNWCNCSYDLIITLKSHDSRCRWYLQLTRWKRRRTRSVLQLRSLAVLITCLCSFLSNCHSVAANVLPLQSINYELCVAVRNIVSTIVNPHYSVVSSMNAEGNLIDQTYVHFHSTNLPAFGFNHLSME
jgi:hypothetical protein